MTSLRAPVQAAGLALVAALALAGCAAEQPAAQTTTVVVDGSSTVFPISEAVAEGFQTGAGQGIRVTVAESGTGGGFKKFCRGETQVQGASRPITAAEMQACAEAGIAFIELPIAFDALSVVVHPDNPVRELTVEQLARIWSPDSQGQVDNWRDIDPSFPDLPLTLYGPGSASGTFEYFTEAVVGTARASRTDYTPSEDDNVLVQGVLSDRGGLAYFGLAYYLANQERVRALSIKPSADAPGVYPSQETVQSGAYVPLARPIFVYVNAAALDNAAVQEFATYFVQNAAKYAAEVNYVPLPARAYEVGAQRISERRTGTAFGGRSDIGGNIEEALARELGAAADAAAGQ